MIRSFKTRFLAASVVLLFLGCSSRVPPPLAGSPLEPLETRAWISKVSITDPTLRGDQRAALEESTILLLEDHASEGGYFSDVRAMPGAPASDDLLLEFSFTDFRGRRAIHPAYFPGALLTLTFWIWFGGPIQIEDTSYAGALTVRASDEAILCETRGEKSRQRSLSLYSENYLNQDTSADRDEALKEMLDAAVTCLVRERGMR